MMVSKGIEDIDITIPRDAYNTDKDTPTFNAYLTVVVRDSGGRVVKVHRQRSHSPTANFIMLMLPLTYFKNTNRSVTINNTGGISYSYKPGIAYNIYDIPYPNGTVNNPTYLLMIQVGSGSQTNPYSAYSLASPIANGTGSGQLVYSQPPVSSNVIASGNSAYFTISQTFNNQSGGTITITEVGVILNLVLGQSGTTNTTNIGQVLVWYDVLSSPISVPNGGSVTIYYTFMVNP